MNVEKLYLTNTHPDSFRPGQSAEILGTRWVEKRDIYTLVQSNRLCYRVIYPDGVEDLVAIGGGSNFKISAEPIAPKVKKEVLVVLKARIPDGSYIVTFTGDISEIQELREAGKGLRITYEGDMEKKSEIYYRVHSQTLHIPGDDVNAVMAMFPYAAEEVASFILRPVEPEKPKEKTSDKPSPSAKDTGKYLNPRSIAYMIWHEKVCSTVVTEYDERELFETKEAAERFLLYNSPLLSLEEVDDIFKELSYAFSFSSGANKTFRKRLRKLIASKQK